jgi:hypothetical protein
MSLMSCRECHGEISSQVTFCPKCGCPVQSPGNNPNLEAVPFAPVAIERRQGPLRRVLPLFLLAIIGFGLWWLWQEYSQQNFDGRFTVPAGYIYTYRVNINGTGRLYGYWTSAGRTAGIASATDDTLVSYDLRGPRDRIILQETNHPLSANFDFHTDVRGVYTFEFVNRGLLRSSARNIDLHAAFQPDTK